MNDSNKEVWLVLSHGFNMDGRAASQTITDKIPYMFNLGIEPIVVSAITGKKDIVVEHHQVLPAMPVPLRFDLRHYLKQRILKPCVYRLSMMIICTHCFTKSSASTQGNTTRPFCLPV